MLTDLLHNKTVKDTVTEGFITAVVEHLVPELTEKYGTLDTVQMYEDYLGDDFSENGVFYYPLTLVRDGEVIRQWIKWDVSEPRNFADGIPYSYIGEEPLEISIADRVPEGFDERLTGRPAYFEGGYVTFKMQAASDDKTFLSGKYSQGFADEMIRQISPKIERAFSVSGIEDSTLEILMVFAPETYMEHIAGNVTYRRLLMTARGCSARDFWIKWTNKNSDTVPLTVSDNVTAEDVIFELGEDVPQKIREKEYRFLVRSSADKYQSAMGRKNITEWRELLKRIIKRGEVERAEISEETAELPKPASEEKSEVAFKLQEVLVNSDKPAVLQEEPIPEIKEADNSDLTALLKNILGKDTEADSAEEKSESEYNELLEEDIKSESPNIGYKSEEELRREIEAEIRAKIALEAKQKAEEEAEALRREQERLKEENEKLLEMARRAEEERRLDAEKHRLEIAAREEAEAREKERLAEAARLAVIEQKRLSEAKAEEERQSRMEEEKRRIEEEALRLAEARRLEEERIRLEMEKNKEAERLEKERAAAAAAPKAPKYTYVSKNARLLFRGPVDPNVTKRIHEIIVTTIKYFNKENVYMKIKATVPDPTTVNLHFAEFPEEETELLIQIIKVLGKSSLGITKVFLE